MLSRLGFLAHAGDTAAKVAAGAIDPTRGARLIFNDRLDATLAGLFMTAVVLVVLSSMREWALVLRGRKPAVTRETAFTETAYGA